MTVVYASGRSHYCPTSRTLLSPRAHRICIRSNSRRPSDSCWASRLGGAVRFLRKRIIFPKPLSARRRRLAVASNGKRHSTLFSREVEILIFAQKRRTGPPCGAALFAVSPQQQLLQKGRPTPA